MGVELYITRAEFWADNDHSPITTEEWLAYVQSDPELKLWPENGPYFVRWVGPSKHEEPWLDWCQGNISTKWPDTALYRKMLQVAQGLNAQIQDDDGMRYQKEADWEFDPAPSLKSAEPERTTAWWRRFLRG